MKQLLQICILILVSCPALAGEAIWAFEPGKPPPAETLKNVPVKGVVAEFLDPDGTHLGKEVGYLIWREVLTAVSDQGGAGVIFAHPPGNERLVDMLQQNYHRAAVEIAEAQKARMALWGAVSEDGGTVIIDTYLSLIGDVAHTELALKMTKTLGPHSDDTGVSASIARVRFNFPRVRITSKALFERPLVVQGDTDVRAGAGTGATLRRVHADDVLQADGMDGEWFRVQLPNGGRGYVRSWNVYVPPRQIYPRKELYPPVQMELFAEPGSRAQGNPTVQSDTALDVVASRYVSKSGLWYQVKTPDRVGWVRADQVRTHFSVPVVHFAAGLYRYQLGRYPLAAQEFEEYTKSDGVAEDPASLSTAYQLLGASLMAAHSDAGPALAKAIAITPFDANARVLRALSTLANSRTAREVLPDLAKALELDPEQSDASNLVAQLLELAKGHYRPLVGEGIRLRIDETDLRDLGDLASKYHIGPLPR